MGSPNWEIWHCLWLETWLDAETQQLQGSGPPLHLTLFLSLLVSFLRWAPSPLSVQPPHWQKAVFALCWHRKFQGDCPPGSRAFHWSITKVWAEILWSDWLGPSLGSSVQGRVGPGDSGTRGATWVREKKFPKREGEHHLQKTGDGNHSLESSLKRQCCLSRETRDHRTAICQGLTKDPRGASCAIRGHGNILSKVSPGTAMQRRLSVCWSLVDLTPQPGAPLSRSVGTGFQKWCVYVIQPYSWLVRDKSQNWTCQTSDEEPRPGATKAAVPMWLNTKHRNLRACCGSGFHSETRKAGGSEVSNRDTERGVERCIETFGERCMQREKKEISGSFRFLIPSLLKFSCSPSDVPWGTLWFLPSLFNELTGVLLLSTSILTTTASVRRQAREQGGCFLGTGLWHNTSLQHPVGPRGAEAEQFHKTLEHQARPPQKHVRLKELSDVLPEQAGKDELKMVLGCWDVGLIHSIKLKEGWVTCRQQDSPGGFENHLQYFFRCVWGLSVKLTQVPHFCFI